MSVDRDLTGSNSWASDGLTPPGSEGAITGFDRRVIRRAHYALVVLSVAYMLAFIDRQILSLLVEPIRRDLQITDVQVSLLQGIAFALLYCAFALPAGRLADIGSRRILIAAGICAWSLMTAICGFAQSFGGLFLARAGVGIGESVLSPAAYSTLADAYPPHRVPKAIAYFTIGGAVGIGLGYIIGGSVTAYVSHATMVGLPILGDVKPWQAAFILVGLPGLLVSVLALTMREPARRGMLLDEESGTASTVRVAEVLRFVVKRWRGYGALTVGAAALATVGYGYLSWYPTYLHRSYGLDPASAGLRLGLVWLCIGPIGACCGPAVAAYLRRKACIDANPRTVMIMGLALIPLSLGTLAPTAFFATIATIPMVLILAAFLGMSVASLQLVTPNQMRALVSAMFQLVITLVGLGIGPTIVALLSERVFANDLALDKALAIASVAAAIVAAATLALGVSSYRKMLQEASGWSNAPTTRSFC